jgi:hypothetical protein
MSNKRKHTPYYNDDGNYTKFQNTNKETEENVCALCSEQMNPTDSWVLHKFGTDGEHKYHTKCINGWLFSRETFSTFICPLCNTPPPLKNAVKNVSPNDIIKQHKEMDLSKIDFNGLLLDRNNQKYIQENTPIVTNSYDMNFMKQYEVPKKLGIKGYGHNWEGPPAEMGDLIFEPEQPRGWMNFFRWVGGKRRTMKGKKMKKTVKKIGKLRRTRQMKKIRTTRRTGNARRTGNTNKLRSKNTNTLRTRNTRRTRSV